MTTTITQRSKHDCGLCCLAMALDIEYEEALTLLPAEPGSQIPTPDILMEVIKKPTMPFGITPLHMARILFEEGVASATFSIEEYSEAMQGDITPMELHKFLNQRHLKAVIFVATNDPIQGHALFWTGAVLIDPADGSIKNSDDGLIHDSEFHLLEGAYAVTFIYEAQL